MNARSWIIVALLASAPPAFAQSSPEDIAKAKALVDAGVTAQRDGQFDLAIGNYQRAYDITHHPVLVYNMAQAHRLASVALAGKNAEEAAKHRDLAREMYRRYLAEKPDPELEITAEGWLGKLDKQWAIENPREEAARQQREEAERQSKISAERTQLQREESRVREAVRDEKLGKARTVKIVGLSAMGAGLAATGVGVFFGLRARSIANDLESRDVYDPAKFEDGDRAERYMSIAYITGGVLLLGGTITYWQGRGIESSAPQVTVSASGTGAAVLVNGQF
jgi:hypothetical protein